MIKKLKSAKSKKLTHSVRQTPEALLVTNDNYLPVLEQLLDHAKLSIDIIAFSFAIGTLNGAPSKRGAPFLIAEKLAALKRKYKSKIKIRLYIEGKRETADRNRVTGDFLKKAGVEVKYGATHAKGFCIDGKYVLFGSTNLTNQSITKNNETNLLLDDPNVVAGFDAYFDHLWKGGKHGGIKLSAPLIADGGFKDELLELINQAKKTLEFSIYFFHYTEIEEALIAAHQRKVKIRGFIHDHRAFALSYVRRTRGTVDRLKKAGIRDLHFGPDSLFTHSKYIISDREDLLLGTGNWLHEDVKVHPQLYIHLHNAKLAKQLALFLAKQIKKTKN